MSAPAARPARVHMAGETPDPRQARLDARWLLGLFILAFALRAAWVLGRWLHHGANLDWDDERLHWSLAVNLVRQGSLVSDDGLYAARMPAYPLFLALFAALPVLPVLAAKLAQSLIGAASAVIAQRFAASVCGKRAGWIAGLAVALDPFAIYFANLLLTEVTFTFVAICLVASAWLVVSGRSAGRPTGHFGVAIWGALAVLSRPAALAWLLLVWVLILVCAKPRGRTAAWLLVYVAAFGVPLAAWGLRNQYVIGAPALLSTNGGITLYDAQGPQAQGNSDQQFIQDLPAVAALPEAQRDCEFRRLAVEQMRRDPARVLRLAWTKFRRTWSLTPNEESTHGGATGAASASYTAALLIGAAVGCWRLLRARRAELGRYVLVLLSPVVCFTLIHCVYVGSLRYRIPLMPMLALLAGGVFVAPLRSQPRPAPAAPPAG